jgi:hypothetical protein
MIGNIDFQADSTFSIYVVALLGSGLILLLMAAIGFGATAGSRILNAVIGLVMIGYGVYLGFIFAGGTYWMSIYVFIVPVLLIINIFRSRKSKSEVSA